MEDRLTKHKEAIGSMPKGLKKGLAACRWKRFKDVDWINEVKEEEGDPCVGSFKQTKKGTSE